MTYLGRVNYIFIVNWSIRSIHSFHSSGLPSSCAYRNQYIKVLIPDHCGGVCRCSDGGAFTCSPLCTSSACGSNEETKTTMLSVNKQTCSCSGGSHMCIPSKWTGKFEWPLDCFIGGTKLLSQYGVKVVKCFKPINPMNWLNNSPFAFF